MEWGVKQDLIEEIARKFPEVKDTVEEVIDGLASRSFVKHIIGTPSGTLKDFIRSIITPQKVAQTIKAGQSISARAAVGATKTGIRIKGSEINRGG